MFYNYADFANNVSNLDFQRTNRFSVLFSLNPNNRASDIVTSLGGIGMIFNGAPLGANLLGDNIFNDLLNHTIEYGANKLINQTGIKKLVIGAMNNRLVESLLGEFGIGQALIDFFGLNLADRGLWIESVTIPPHALEYEMDTSYKAPNIRIKGRTYELLTMKFRMDSMSNNYRAFVEWNQSIKDPVNQLVAFPDEVQADIQVNLHDRNGIPHSTHVFNGCVPISVQEGEDLDYESFNEVKTFVVTFAYRTHFTGKVPMENALEWLASRGVDSLIGKAGLSTIDPKYLHSGQQTFNIFGRY